MLHGPRCVIDNTMVLLWYSRQHKDQDMNFLKTITYYHTENKSFKDLNNVSFNLLPALIVSRLRHLSLIDRKSI
jgi:hypothetical protein